MAPITRLLVANRGEIAVRIVRAAFDEGIETVLVNGEVAYAAGAYTDARSGRVCV